MEYGDTIVLSTHACLTGIGLVLLRGSIRRWSSFGRCEFHCGHAAYEAVVDNLERKSQEGLGCAGLGLWIEDG